MQAVDLKRFFNPRAIAIIGASTDITKITGKPLHYLKAQNYKGNIYPINPKYDEVGGHKCYKSILDVPGEVDLVLIAVNYKLVLPMLEACVKKGVRFATIFSSGFAEAGEEGRAMQQQIANLSGRTGLRICGPNCQGAVDLYNTTAAAFSAALDIVPFQAGPVGFVTQSGALGYSIFNVAQDAGVGFSYVVSTGNEMDLDSLDYMNFMLEDENTKMVFAYMEGIDNGEKFSQVADNALDAGKPLAVLKVGRSEAGSKAASSHTATLTGSDEVFSAFFKQKSIIRVDDVGEFTDLAMVVKSISKMPSGKRLGVISTSGGGGVICADAAAEYGLNLAALQTTTLETIEANIPHFGSAVNPVDITAQSINSADGFTNILNGMLKDPGVDALVVVITMIVGEPGLRMARTLVKISEQTDKPIVVAWTSGSRLMAEQFKVLADGNVPCFQSPSRAVHALSRVMQYGSALKEHQNAKTPDLSLEKVSIPEEARAILDNNSGSLTENQSKILLNAFGISTGKEEVAANIDEAREIAQNTRYPLAMKMDSPDILHKTEAKAILLNIQNESEMVAAFNEIMTNSAIYNPKARINGVLIQEMIPKGEEVIVGMTRDPQFGPTIMFGLGGIFVEILKDVALRIAPLDINEAKIQIREIKGFGVLAGARGRTKADLEALADTLVKVSRMAVTLGPKMKELDINPLVVLPEGQGVRVADALIILEEKG